MQGRNLKKIIYSLKYFCIIIILPIQYICFTIRLNTNYNVKYFFIAYFLVSLLIFIYLLFRVKVLYLLLYLGSLFIKDGTLKKQNCFTLYEKIYTVDSLFGYYNLYNRKYKNRS